MSEILNKRTAKRCRDISRRLSPRSGRNRRNRMCFETRTPKGCVDVLARLQRANTVKLSQPEVALAALTDLRLISTQPFGVSD
jgi:hypothetical protein